MSAKGTVTAETVFDAVVNGELSMGYSNPYTSATGINFLMTALSTLSPDDMLSENAVSKFQAFQANIPLVSYTTQQMTSSAEKGLIDALVSEYQTYANDSTLTRNFEFIPFGVRHDNPLYAIEVVEHSDEDQVLKAFAEYCDQHQDLARKDGFNGMDEYAGSGAKFTGLQVSEAQTIWKEEKASGKTIVAEFIVDVSGSMSGEPINNLRAAMKNTMRYISDEHYIGVLAFDDDVYEYLPIDKFTLEQKTLYNGAVNSLTAAGSTGMYDAILVGVDKVIKKCDELGSNATPIIFVLTDGETNSGNNYSDVKSILDGLDIPIYSISYNYSNDELGKLSNLNEASYINGDSENIVYKLKNLFNVEM
jgi:Ca-activated chloride channel family protein